MKPVPQTIQLGAFTYAIKRCDGGEPSRIDCDKQEIWLSESLHPQQAAYCLFREALAVAMRDSAESTVHTDDIALKVIEVWAQNPEVVAWIMAGFVDSKKPENEGIPDYKERLHQAMDEHFKRQIRPNGILGQGMTPEDMRINLRQGPSSVDSAKSIWWKEPVYASVDGITTADNPYKVAVGWKAYPITAEDLGTLKKLKLSANEACEEGLGGIVDDRFTFLPHIIHDSIDGERFIMTQSTWNTIMDKIGSPEVALKDGYATIKNSVMRLDGPQKLGQETF